MIHSNCKIQGKAIRHPTAQGEYPWKDKLGRDPDTCGEDVVPPINSRQVYCFGQAGWSWSEGVANTRGHPPECMCESSQPAMGLGVRSREPTE